MIDVVGAVDPAEGSAAPAAYADLVAALSALDDLRRDKQARVEMKGGGTYSYAYTDLAGVLGAVRPVLAAHGFAVVQPVETIDDKVRVWTELVHRTGERFPSPALSMRQPDMAQTLGSLITYLRRYTLLAALGLATEDDDGKAASTPPPRRDPIVDERSRRRRHAMKLFDDLGLSDRDERLKVTSEIIGHEVKSWSDTTAEEQVGVIADLIERREKEQDAEFLRQARDADDEADARTALWDEADAET